MHASVHRQIKLICFQLLISIDQQARTYIPMNTTATPASEDFTFTNETERMYRSSSFCHATYASENTIQARWDLLSDFVRETCAIHGRDDSHGHAHMQAVAQQARTIIQQDHIDDTGTLTLDAITAAWLHDIADHKYDSDGSLQALLDTFGNKHIWNYPEIKQVIKYISYSSENRALLAGTPLDYPAILGAYYSQIRDIVSDADKLEALGATGVHRAIEYTTQANPSYSRDQVIADVKKHAQEKLFRLASEFIRNPTARAIAKTKHNEMLAILTSL